MAGSHRVPVPFSIIPHELVHVAMNNFGHKKNTVSGIGGSHNTILILFQNIKDAERTVRDKLKRRFKLIKR